MIWFLDVLGNLTLAQLLDFDMSPLSIGGHTPLHVRGHDLVIIYLLKCNSCFTCGWKRCAFWDDMERLIKAISSTNHSLSH